MDPVKLIRDNILRDGESITLSELCEALANSTATPPCFVPDPAPIWQLCLDSPGIGTDTGRGTVWRID